VRKLYDQSYLNTQEFDILRGFNFMFKKKCHSCKEKVDRKFLYCPWCGVPLKDKRSAQEDYGMLGNNDEVQMQQAVNDMKLPFGLNGIVNTLMKQIEKEMSNMDNMNGPKPKGFKIQFSTGMPNMQAMNPQPVEQTKTVSSIERFNEKVSEDEQERRAKLKQVPAKSTIRRLPEGLIYEIETPGVTVKKDITLTKLEQSLELKAYTKDKCYVKKLPSKVEILGMAIKGGKIFLRLK